MFISRPELNYRPIVYGIEMQAQKLEICNIYRYFVRVKITNIGRKWDIIFKVN